MSGPRRIVPAIRRRIRGPYRSLGAIDQRVDTVQAQLADLQRLLEASVADTSANSRWIEEIEARLGALAQRSDEASALATANHDLASSTHTLLHDELRALLRALAADETGSRRRLNELRASAGYDLAWDEPTPLVTVTIATRDRPELLVNRALASILAQTHTHLEVIVVGDGECAEIAEAVRAIGDPRVVYRNLTQRLHFTDDPHRQWLVGATMARNEAMALAQGRWVVAFDDDDAMRSQCIERLLDRAREARSEVAYGVTSVRYPDRPEYTIGRVFPPQFGQFTWACGLYHAGLRFLERELFAADMDVPGDWYLALRMLRAGVRFAAVDEVLCDIYPSRRF
jgi:hypothetical protein